MIEIIHKRKIQFSLKGRQTQDLPIKSLLDQYGWAQPFSQSCQIQLFFCLLIITCVQDKGGGWAKKIKKNIKK